MSHKNRHVEAVKKLNNLLLVIVCLFASRYVFYKPTFRTLQLEKCQFDKNVNFPTQFFLGYICNRFDAFEYREVFLKENLNDFLVDYKATNKLEMPKFHKYLMGKNNM